MHSPFSFYGFHFEVSGIPQKHCVAVLGILIAVA